MPLYRSCASVSRKDRKPDTLKSCQASTISRSQVLLTNTALAPAIAIAMDHGFPAHLGAAILVVDVTMRPVGEKPPEQREDLLGIVRVVDAAHFHPVDVVQQVDRSEMAEPLVAGVAQLLEYAGADLEQLGVELEGVHLVNLRQEKSSGADREGGSGILVETHCNRFRAGCQPSDQLEGGRTPTRSDGFGVARSLEAGSDGSSLRASRSGFAVPE